MDSLEQMEYKKMIKAVRFDYYQIYLKVLDGDHFVEQLLDINNLLVYAQEISPANRMCFINGSDEVRLQALNLSCRGTTSYTFESWNSFWYCKRYRGIWGN